MNNKQARSSNIELLRIISMFMIIIYHIIIHCVNVQLVNVSSIEALENGWFNNPLYYRQLLYLSLCMPLGLVGNSIFIMISGYFLVDRDIDILKVSKKMLSQLLFAAVALVLISAAFIHNNEDITSVQYLFSYIKIQYFNKMSWFVGYYFIIMLVAYMFLNKFLAKLDYKKYLGFLLAILAVSQLSWSGSLLDDLASGLRTVMVGVFFYAFGGFIKKYNPFARVRGYVFFLIIALTNLIIGISYHNNVIGKIESYYFNLAEAELDPAAVTDMDFIQSIPKFQNYSIVVVILGICLFEIFRRIKLPTIKPINFIAQATFMIYLLHDNGFAYSIWLTQDWITVLYNNCWDFAQMICTWAVKIFLFGFMAYLVYLLLLFILKKCRFLFIKD
ncbi:MAG: acyltransferase family protein [Pseudobutyrivibrio sp.]|nr:acyltransferase family protein [Pseudobutyrivibrio sp.]